jgi:ketosteroid isomerase-like protein
MSEENVEVVRRWWDVFNTTGMPPLSLCDERIEIRNPPDFPVRGSFHGHQGVRDWRDQVFEAVDNVSVEAEEIIDVTDDGETVVMLLRTRATGHHTRIEVDFPWAAIWTIRDGKLLFAQGYLSRRKPSKPQDCGSRRCRRRTSMPFGALSGPGTPTILTPLWQSLIPRWRGIPPSSQPWRAGKPPIGVMTGHERPGTRTS